MICCFVVGFVGCLFRIGCCLLDSCWGERDCAGLGVYFLLVWLLVL